jgi:hypothetical protein
MGLDRTQPGGTRRLGPYRPRSFETPYDLPGRVPFDRGPGVPPGGSLPHDLPDWLEEERAAPLDAWGHLSRALGWLSIAAATALIIFGLALALANTTETAPTRTIVTAFGGRGSGFAHEYRLIAEPVPSHVEGPGAQAGAADSAPKIAA